MRRMISEFNEAKILRIAILVLADIITINLAGFLALYVRFEFNLAALLESGFLESLRSYMVINTIVTVAVFWLCRLYNSLWEHADLLEIIRVAAGSAAASILQEIGMLIMHLEVPNSFLIYNAFFLMVLAGGLRICYRLLRRFKLKKKGRPKNIMVIGAGGAGELVIRDLRSRKNKNYKIVCLIDDDKRKWGEFLLGVKVIGGCNEIEKAAKQYRVHEIVLAIQSISNRKKLDIIQKCHNTNCTLKTMSVTYQDTKCANSKIQIRDVNISDLLGRDELTVNMDDIAGYIKGKTVLVTGGGGSIGSELCRQVAANEPKQLVIFDIYENNAYAIQQELIRQHPELNMEVLIGSVRDRERIFNVMDKYRPDLVCHAAAHKHVPLMEVSPAEAIKNNVFGTLNTAQAASYYGVRRFILISTDKAVNPTNIMGATKRICEMIIQMLNERSATEYVAVRFGNVLGSNGSVIPLFKQQIMEGGPVTVTDKNIIRYFMTIPEAVSLVLQAGAFAKGGEIFVLDMGEPVKIDDLARNLIKLSGYEPDVDIPIVYTGLRPGEKLYEELLLQEEKVTKTKNDMIYIGHELSVDAEVFEKQLQEMRNVENMSIQNIKELIMRTVPTYKTPAVTIDTPSQPKEPVLDKTPVMV